MSCKGICTRHKASKPTARLGRYTVGQKRCRITITSEAMKESITLMIISNGD